MVRFLLCAVAVILACSLATGWAAEPEAVISLRETVRTSALFDLRKGSVPIIGSLTNHGIGHVRVRVITSLGKMASATLTVRNGEFRCLYPNDFPGAPKIESCMLFINATADPSSAASPSDQAEAGVLIYDSRSKLIPDMPVGFMTGLRDKRGRVDSDCSQWPVVRDLVNSYMHNRAAKIAGIGRPDFDLGKPADLAWFKKNLTLYEFGYRDRDWSKPLGHRVARTFWQSVWDTWFNSSNDNPLDGNKENAAQSNYLPYGFANDFSDILIAYLMRLRGCRPLEDDLTLMCREGVENLLAMQHTGANNFALTDFRGHRENYTAGAFRYGVFENGEFMTEGKGWFYNPAFLDYADGGVINGRAVWAMGEALKADPGGPEAVRIKAAIALSVRFCLNDSLASSYAKKTSQGNVYWRDVGEHAYLVTGMLAACSVAPDLPVVASPGKPATTLREACVSALNALVDLEQPHHQWAIYPNFDSFAIVALADGVSVLRDHPDAPRWRKVAVEAADAWLNAKVDPKEFPGTPVHFGLRTAPDRMTYIWNRSDPRNVIYFYQSGHWIHALARLYAVTGDAKYRRRAEAMISYLCGNNPWDVCLLNETGGVPNWVEDTDGDGVEDQLKNDMYPESTAFCQIGIMHLLRAIQQTNRMP